MKTSTDTKPQRVRDLFIKYDSKVTKRGIYVFGMKDSGKYVIYLNGETERIFSSYSECETWFEIFISR